VGGEVVEAPGGVNAAADVAAGEFSGFEFDFGNLAAVMHITLYGATKRVGGPTKRVGGRKSEPGGFRGGSRRGGGTAEYGKYAKWVRRSDYGLCDWVEPFASLK
jgi:hypothetical protein